MIKIKEHYKIGEISSLYNIGADSLRYYEKIGILSPKRNESGYRVYSIRDIWKINVIRDLRKLNFSMSRIKEYLDDRDLTSTRNIFLEELSIINEKIDTLEILKKSVKDRINNIDEGLLFNAIEEIKIKYVDDRKVLQIEESVSRDEEVDFLLKKLNKDHEDKLYLLGNNTMGTTISMECIQRQEYNKYNSVFIELDRNEDKYDFILPSGEYVYVCYRGNYRSNKRVIPNMLEFIKNNGYFIESDFIEICKIDIHETSKVSEFLTELQVMVRK